jgi:hypothetical protein
MPKAPPRPGGIFRAPDCYAGKQSVYHARRGPPVATTIMNGITVQSGGMLMLNTTTGQIMITGAGFGIALAPLFADGTAKPRA